MKKEHKKYALYGVIALAAAFVFFVNFEEGVLSCLPAETAGDGSRLRFHDEV